MQGRITCRAEPHADVPHDVRGEVGVCSSSVASGHHLDHRHDFTGQADLAEAHAGGQLPHLLLVLRKQKGVLQAHCQAGDALVQHSLPQDAKDGQDSTATVQFHVCKGGGL